jgi:hypothetical protein
VRAHGVEVRVQGLGGRGTGPRVKGQEIYECFIAIPNLKAKPTVHFRNTAPPLFFLRADYPQIGVLFS